MMNKTETADRIFDFEIRAENDADHGDHLTGRPIVYGEKTDLGYFDEIIDKGALDNTDLRDVAFVVNHDISMIPLARSRRNTVNSTMQMTVDDQGMLIRVDLDTQNNPTSAALYSAVKRGDVSGMSFRFKVDGESWENLDSDHPTRHVTSIASVREVSAVTYPAYEGAVIAARSKDDALDSAKSALDSARRDEKTAKDAALKAKLELKLKLSQL